METKLLCPGFGLETSAVDVSRPLSTAEFAELEQTCCPFLTFRIGLQPGKTVWIELTGPVAAQEIIRELIPDPL